MKASFVAVSLSAVAVLVSALARTSASPVMHPESLARIEAIASYCEKVDPGGQSQYISKLAGMTSGHFDDELQRDRDTIKYRQAMAQANEMLAKVTPARAARGCTEFLADGQ